MKIVRILLIVCSLCTAFYSCETYSDPEVEYSSIFPVSGEWVVSVKDLDTDSIVELKSKSNKAVMYTYNTASESTTQMWLRMSTVTKTDINLATKGKVDLNLSEKTFSVTDIQNASLSIESKFSIKNGKVLLEQARPISGGVADSIYFELTTDASPDKTYAISGYRRTGWPEDEP